MEEKVYFQSHVTHDLEADHEFLRFVRLTNTKLIVLRIIVCVLLCFFVWSSSILSNEWILLLYCGVFIGSHFITWLQLRKGSTNYQQSLVLNHGAPIVNILSFMDTCIRSVNPDNENVHTYDYCNVQRISETKNFLILVYKANLGVVVNKHNLTGGTKDELIAFLQSHCPNLKKKIRRDTVAKVIATLYAVVLAVVLLIGLFRLPLFSDISARISGKISDSASYTEIATELEKLGITGIDDNLIASLEQYDHSYSHYNTAYYKTLNLLSWVGMGEYNEDDWNWTPSSNGVFWMDSEVYDIQYMYSDFLTGISALDKELDFQIIREWTETDHWDTGSQFIHFSWNGEEYTLTGELYYDWFDFQVAKDLNKIIENTNTGKQLYFAFDGGQGVLVFYRDAQWVREFQRKTGIELSTDPHSIW
jgi:hypothetical protein